MRYSLLLLGIASSVFVTLADQGNTADVGPTGSYGPTQAGPAPRTVVPTAAAPLCEHDADPDGAQGLCPNLAYGGWCDCDSAGIYPTLRASDICGYTSLDPKSTIVLSTTNCISSGRVLRTTWNTCPYYTDWPFCSGITRVACLDKQSYPIPSPRHASRLGRRVETQKDNRERYRKEVSWSIKKGGVESLD